MLGERDHQAERVLGDGRVVDAGREEDGDLLRRRVLHVDRVEADAVLGDDLAACAASAASITFCGDEVVAVEQPVEPVVAFDEVEHLLLGERPAGADDLEAAGGEHVVVLAGGVLVAGGGEEDSHAGGEITARAWKAKARASRPRSRGRES